MDIIQKRKMKSVNLILVPINNINSFDTKIIIYNHH